MPARARSEEERPAGARLSAQQAFGVTARIAATAHMIDGGLTPILGGLMARVREFLPTTQRLSVHTTTVECEFGTVGEGGSRVLHLSTFGSKDRASERKSSQSIQLDVEHARQLVVIIADFLAATAMGEADAADLR
jgi:hypothetical protein